MTIADTSTGAAQATAPRAVSLTNLTVERRRDPLGIDAARPRFGWQLLGDGPGARQAACQIQVIDSSQPGAGWSAPVWDSNRLESPASTYVAYAGPALESRRRYAWRVRAWDGDGAETQWSTPGEFEMGLLSLGSALTGCWSTLLQSAEGRLIQKSLGQSTAGVTYLNLLMSMVGRVMTGCSFSP